MRDVSDVAVSVISVSLIAVELPDAPGFAPVLHQRRAKPAESGRFWVVRQLSREIMGGLLQKCRILDESHRVLHQLLSFERGFLFLASLPGSSLGDVAGPARRK